MALTDDYLTPEARARAEKIDRLLREADWIVQGFKEMTSVAAKLEQGNGAPGVPTPDES